MFGNELDTFRTSTLDCDHSRSHFYLRIAYQPNQAGTNTQDHGCGSTGRNERFDGHYGHQCSSTIITNCMDVQM